MKKIFLLIAACFSLTAPLAAQHCHGPYVSGTAGANFKTDSKIHGETRKWNPGVAATGAVGYKFAAPVRVELEGAYRNYNGKKTQTLGSYHRDVFSVMGNGYYDFDQLDLPLGMTPYVGAGIGTAFSEEKDHGKFAWQGIAGVSVPLNQRLDLITEYRYFNGGFKNDNNHTIGAGLRFWF